MYRASTNFKSYASSFAYIFIVIFIYDIGKTLNVLAISLATLSRFNEH